ncbi:uncharacterized protein LOC126598993 [Malus sylvestris]|uniref:uncharacterized protein LOC126598993 n=1 Tax=Malus sylvestris TaxID=3752 RepID=UPI0021AC4AA5|nr:uncharacterized protein LOC126598993 [Malus sylvestris]
MELSIVDHRKKKPITDFKKDKVFALKVDKTRKKLANKAFAIHTTPIKTSITPIKIFSKSKINEMKEDKEDEIPKEDVTAALPQLEDGGQATIDDLKKLNLGTNEESKPIFVNAPLSVDEIEKYYQLFLKYKDVFVWTYKEMPDLNLPSSCIILQSSPEHDQSSKLKDAINPSSSHKLISNIVIVLKKSGQIHVCVDFRDLNDVCLNGDFPLPIIKIIVDTTTSHEELSFMDGFFGYNQIRIAPEDEEPTAFHTPKCIYCYKIIYVPTIAINGQALVDFLADHPILADWKISYDLPD